MAQTHELSAGGRLALSFSAMSTLTISSYSAVETLHADTTAILGKALALL